MAEPASAPTKRKTSDALLAAAVLTVAAGLGLLGYLLAFTDADFSSATLGLVLTGIALVFCLRALFRMVTVLSRPDVAVALEQLPTSATASQRELREERRRLLRAINELKFDHEMGKLSAADYNAVRQSYELQAIEVMRALDAEPDLHPDLRTVLRERGLLDGEPAATDGEREGADSSGSADGEDDDAASQAAASPPAEVTPDAGVSTCAAREGVNDVDAEFGTHSGKEMGR